MNFKISILILLLFITKIINAQSVSTLMGSRAAGIAYASATLSDEWSALNNPGSLGKISKTTIAFAHQVTPSLIGGNKTAVALNAPLGIGTLSTSIFHFGDDFYNEQIVSIAYGNQFGITSLGVQATYIQYHAEGFKNKTAIGINFGGVTQITPEIQVGAYITNLNQPKLDDNNDERLPTKMVVGIQFMPTDKLMLVTELEKDLEYDPTWRSGVEYGFYKKLFARTGFSFHPNAAFAGIGYRLMHLNIDYALSFRHETQLTHQVSACIILHKNKSEK